MNELSSVIAEIYDTSVDAAKWPSALRSACRFVNSTYGAIIFEQKGAPERLVQYCLPGECSWLRAYLQQQDAIGASRLFELVEGEVFSVTNLATREEFKSSEAYRRHLEPQGIVDLLGVLIERSTFGVSALVTFRSATDGIADDSSKSRLRWLAPHLTRAASIHRLIGESRTAPEPFAKVVERLASPIFFVDEHLRLAYANESARTALATGSMVQEKGGALMIGDKSAQERLSHAVARCAQGDAAISACDLAILIQTDQGNCCIAHVLPLTGETHAAGETAGAVAAVFVKHIGSRSFKRTELLELFGLTPRELSILILIVELGGVPATAQALGLTEGTVKTYLKNIFSKTGARRQSDLVKVVSAFESPFLCRDSAL